MTASKLAGILKMRQNLLRQPMDESVHTLNARRALICLLQCDISQLAAQNKAQAIAGHVKIIAAEQGSDGFFIVDDKLGLSVVDVLHKYKSMPQHQVLIEAVSGALADLMHDEHVAEKERSARQRNWLDKARSEFDASQSRGGRG